MAKALGFVAKFTDSANRLKWLNEALEAVLECLGPIPHGPIVAMVAEGAIVKKKQTTRMLSLVAVDCECAYTRKWLDEYGTPMCPHGVPMKEI
ncbi:hypothetical protein [Nonomuraea sp. NPDC046570]|uniref:hypothetical protein n=1 Tax=Nonomuraea sp. NPDC046570 TaxID=3155255 RepID=UPI0033C0F81D